MSYNTNNTTVKRLLSELRKLRSDPDPNFVAGPVTDDDLFVWHFTIRGTPDSAFQGGIYHGKIVFPHNYPLTPPDIFFLTPNGRFEINRALCLSFTSYHPESWNPGWDIRTVLTSVIAFMPTKAEGAIGGIDAPDSERRKYAIESRKWKCSQCDLHLEPDNFPEEKEEHSEEKNEIEHTEDIKPAEEDLPPKNDVETKLEDIKPDEQVENADEGKIEFDMNDFLDNTDNTPAAENNEEEVPINDQPAEEVLPPKNGVDFESLRSASFNKKGAFYPALDIPILLIFCLMLVLIANSFYHFIKPYERLINKLM